jgi:hypothetical protein
MGVFRHHGFGRGENGGLHALAPASGPDGFALFHGYIKAKYIAFVHLSA